jgi:hypothetical protein
MDRTNEPIPIKSLIKGIHLESDKSRRNLLNHLNVIVYMGKEGVGKGGIFQLVRYSQNKSDNPAGINNNVALRVLNFMRFIQI